jgi:hypothetical protein
VNLYIHSPIHFNGVVVNWSSIGTALPFSYMQGAVGLAVHCKQHFSHCLNKLLIRYAECFAMDYSILKITINANIT